MNPLLYVISTLSDSHDISRMLFHPFNTHYLLPKITSRTRTTHIIISPILHTYLRRNHIIMQPIIAQLAPSI